MMALHPPPESGEPADSAAPAEPLCVLLVEDDPEDAEFALRALRQLVSFRASVTHARDADSALEALSRIRFDVILLDYRLGSRTGFDFLAEAFAGDVRVPTVLLTGAADPEFDVQAARAGAAGLLEKSELRPARLERSIRYALEHGRTQASLRSAHVLYRAALDALADHVAILDEQGRILKVNRAWRDFAACNGGPTGDVWTGVDYLAVCRGAAEVSPEARETAAGIQRVLAGDLAEFRLEYPCHAAAMERWFEVRVTHFADHELGRVLVAHADITERRRAALEREALLARESLARVEAERQRERTGEVLASITDAFATVDRSWRLTYVNESAAALMDGSPEVLRGRAIWEVVPAPMRDLVEAHCARFAGAGQPVTLAVPVPWLSVELAVRLYPTRDGFVIYARDVTEQVRAYGALRESEERFRQLAENIRQVFWISPLPGLDPTYVSPAFEEVWGLSPEQLREDPRAWLRCVHPDDRAVVLANHAHEELPERGFDVTYRIQRPDGESRWIHDRGFPVRDERGLVYRIAGIAEDVTDRQLAEAQIRNSERKFRSLIENVSDLIGVLDGNGRFLYASPAFERSLGYTPESILHTDALARVHPDDLQTAREALARALDMPAETVAIRIRYAHATGRWRTMDVVATNLMGDPAVGGIVVISRDVTDQLQLEAQLRQAQKMEAVGQLAGGVAHDFNNILTAILSYTDLLRGDLRREDPLFDDVEQIRRAALRAAGLTRQLLAFSRRQVLQPRILHLGHIVAELSPMLERLLGEDVELVVEKPAQEVTVRADPGQLEQVILNLVVNARDAMPDGGVITISIGLGAPDRVLLHADPELAPGPYAELIVRDTGIGIPGEILPHIFEPFFTTKEHGQGTGLGLPTAYGIVRQSGGAILVESAPGSGATFRVLLPLAVEETAGAPGPTAVPLASRRARETILLVEDEAAVREVGARMLARNGYRVLTAASGSEALQLLGRAGVGVDLVITDLVMPQMSGHALATEVEARGLAPAVLYTSGYAADEMFRRGFLPPGVAFLPKPFTMESLTEAVSDALESAQRTGAGPSLAAAAD